MDQKNGGWIRRMEDEVKKQIKKQKNGEPKKMEDEVEQFRIEQKSVGWIRRVLDIGEEW